MRVRRLTICVLATALHLSAAEPTREPKDFKGIQWGASHSEAARVVAFGNTCEPYTVGTEMLRRCRVNLNLGRVWPVCYVFFHNDRFVETQWVFDAEHYTYVRDVLEERYGPPSTASDAAPGAVWQWPTVTAVIVRGTTGKSFVSIAEREYLAWKSSGSDEQKKKAAREF